VPFGQRLPCEAGDGGREKPLSRPAVPEMAAAGVALGRQGSRGGTDPSRVPGLPLLSTSCDSPVVSSLLPLLGKAPARRRSSAWQGHPLVPTHAVPAARQLRPPLARRRFGTGLGAVCRRCVWDVVVPLSVAPKRGCWALSGGSCIQKRIFPVCLWKSLEAWQGMASGDALGTVSSALPALLWIPLSTAACSGHGQPCTCTSRGQLGWAQQAPSVALAASCSLKLLPAEHPKMVLPAW